MANVVLVLLLVLEFVFVVLPHLVGRGVLVLLVLGHQVVHVALRLGELHLVHALPGVPVEEGLAAEHGGELLGDPPEQLLDGRAVADEGGGHLESAGRDVAHGRLHVVGDPLHEVAAVLVLHAQHLLVHLLHGHATAEDGRHREVAPVAGVARRHHVLGVEHLLRELGHGEGAVLLAAPAGERREARHEEVQAGEGHHVDGQLAEVGVELAGEAEAGGDAAHGGRHQVVEVAVGGRGQLERAEADVVERLVVDAEGLVRVLHQLVHGERGVVGLHHRVGHLGRGHDAESVHDAVGVLLADLADEQGAHAGAGAAAQGVGELEALEAVTVLSLLPHHIQH